MPPAAPIPVRESSGHTTFLIRPPTYWPDFNPVLKTHNRRISPNQRTVEPTVRPLQNLVDLFPRSVERPRRAFRAPPQRSVLARGPPLPAAGAERKRRRGPEPAGPPPRVHPVHRGGPRTGGRPRALRGGRLAQVGTTFLGLKGFKINPKTLKPKKNSLVSASEVWGLS
jgi:hypothetical protein